MCTTLYSTHYIITIKGTLRNTLCIKSVYRIDGKAEEIYNVENTCFRTEYRKTLKLVRPAEDRIFFIYFIRNSFIRNSFIKNSFIKEELYKEECGTDKRNSYGDKQKEI